MTFPNYSINYTIRPHRGYGNSYEYCSCDNEVGIKTVFARQSTSCGFENYIDYDQPFDVKYIDIDHYKATYELLNKIDLIFSPQNGFCGLGGVNHTIEIDFPYAQNIILKWQNELPKEWVDLNKIINRVTEQFNS